MSTEAQTCAIGILARSLFGRLNNEVRRNLADKATAFHRSSLREKALPQNACRPKSLCVIGAISVKKSVKSVKSVVKNQSIKNNKLCETNPISEKQKMNLNPCSAKDYENKSPLLKMAKQTQSNPTCSELVEPILPAYGGFTPKICDLNSPHF
jgi:hypothetical protein